MPKGRQHVPSHAEVGIWFQHRGLPTNIVSRDAGTTTGIMLNDPYCADSRRYSLARCPPPFLHRSKTMFVGNPFSKHDNRNSFQDHGVYLGQQLGKKKVVCGQHASDDLITWGERKNADAVEINSMYREDFNKVRCTTTSHNRRYPKEYNQPKEGLVKLTTKTPLMVEKDEIVPRTYFQTLANSQQPYLKANPWKFSYHSHSFAQRPKITRSKTLPVS